MSFKIVTDSTANLSVEYCTKNDVSVVSLFYILNGQENTAYDEHNPNSLDEFYDKLKQKPRASTSCANEDSYYKVFEDAYKKGQEVLYIGFSSGVSATYSSALLAKNMILDTYPDAKIYCVDTLTGSFGQGHFIMKVVQMRNEGKSVEDCFNYVTQERFKMRTFVTVDDLYFLYQGGRIPALTYKIGTLVKIKPIIEVNTEGKLVSVNKVLSRKHSLSALFTTVKDNISPNEESIVYIAHGDCVDDANILAEKLKTQLAVKEVVIDKLEAVIGTHTGAGAIAIFFLGESRKTN